MNPSLVEVLLEVKILKIITIIGTEGSRNILSAARFDLTSPLLRHGSSPPPLSGGAVRAPLPSPLAWFEVSSPLWWRGSSSPPLSGDSPLPLRQHRSSPPLPLRWYR
jgi:hypothetical protein